MLIYSEIKANNQQKVKISMLEMMLKIEILKKYNFNYFSSVKRKNYFEINSRIFFL